jgi:hypothetical protein
MSATELYTDPSCGAVLDEAHIGDIRGAFGTIRHGDIARRNGWWARFRTLLAILGLGLIVMVGDNDAGAFGTQARTTARRCFGPCCCSCPCSTSIRRWSCAWAS